MSVSRFVVVIAVVFGFGLQSTSAQLLTGSIVRKVKSPTLAPPPSQGMARQGDLCGMASFSCASVDLDGNPTGGGIGADTVINVDLMTGGIDVTVVGIGWDVGIEAMSPSYLSEANIDFSGAVSLAPGLGDDVSGTMTYTSSGIEDLTMVDLDGDGTVDADLSFVAGGGMLTLTLFETFDDAAVAPDGLYLADSTLSIEYIVPVGCDFDDDTDCDIDDLNAMLAVGPIAGGVSAAGNELFDLNGDSSIDPTDMDLWLVSAGMANGLGSAYERGDANLDGTVDEDDFNAWQANKFTSSLQWDNADFNGDGLVNGRDFLAWNENKALGSEAAAAVPEPTSGVSLLLVGLALLTGYRRA